jgi:hypothetical protein
MEEVMEAAVVAAAAVDMEEAVDMVAEAATIDVEKKLNPCSVFRQRYAI